MFDVCGLGVRVWDLEFLGSGSNGLDSVLYQDGHPIIWDWDLSTPFSQTLAFGVWGLGVRVWDLGFGV